MDVLCAYFLLQNFSEPLTMLPCFWVFKERSNYAVLLEYLWALNTFLIEHLQGLVSLKAHFGKSHLVELRPNCGSSVWLDLSGGECVAEICWLQSAVLHYHCRGEHGCLSEFWATSDSSPASPGIVKWARKLAVVEDKEPGGRETDGQGLWEMSREKEESFVFTQCLWNCNFLKQYSIFNLRQNIKQLKWREMCVQQWVVFQCS